MEYCNRQRGARAGGIIRVNYIKRYSPDKFARARRRAANARAAGWREFCSGKVVGRLSRNCLHLRTTGTSTVNRQQLTNFRWPFRAATRARRVSSRSGARRLFERGERSRG
jgi:hypothetical protein